MFEVNLILTKLYLVYLDFVPYPAGFRLPNFIKTNGKIIKILLKILGKILPN